MNENVPAIPRRTALSWRDQQRQTKETSRSDIEIPWVSRSGDISEHIASQIRPQWYPDPYLAYHLGLPPAMMVFIPLRREKPDREPTDGQKETKAAQAIPKPCLSLKPKSYSPPELPDRRAMEGVMKGFLGEMLGGPALGRRSTRPRNSCIRRSGRPTPRSGSSWQSKHLTSPLTARRLCLARRTHQEPQRSPGSFRERGRRWRKGVGPKAFQEHVGHFWSLLETRPYMRAREGLASKLWTMGRRDEAIKHLQDMLRLNPGDNQGVRYTLAGWLLAEGRDEELARLSEGIR